jgi:hypothetical protein
VPGEVRIAGLVCDLAALSVTADGAVPFDRGRPFQVNVRSGALPVEHLAPYLTPLAPYRPVGTIRLDLAGRGAAGADGLRWQGQIHLKDGGFQPPGGLGPVRAVNGSFRWTETGLSAQDLSARLGQSPITASLFVGGRRHPDVRVRLACPRLNLQDAGLRHPRGEGVLTDIDLQAARRNGTWRIQSLTAAMNRTTVQAQGVLRETPEPVADLSLVFPSLDGGDVAFLAGLKGADPSPGQARSRLWKVVVRVGDGRAEGVAFKNLYAGLRFQNGLLDIADGQADVFGGRVRGTGRIDFTAQGRPSYDVRFALERIRAEQVAPPFQGKHGFLAGSLSADGQVKAAGAGWPDLLRTAQGSLSLRCESGTIRKFAVLSKVFSILNVSQLFRFELPDMAAGGMPYDAITGRLTLSDGVIATKDLFIASDAMNLSFVGTVDLVRESLDQTIGVQPLQTVDRLVRRLPIVGWVLSDQDGRVLTVYFEARGPFDNPVVRPIPVRSMSKGVQEIFRNLFHLPVKLFTDTGEVLFGR